MRSPKIKMTMTNAKIGDYPIAPRESSFGVSCGNGRQTRGHSSLSQAPFLSGVCTLLGLVAPQSRGWAVGCGRDALFETRRLPVRKKTAYRFVKKEDRSTTKMPKTENARAREIG